MDKLKEEPDYLRSKGWVCDGCWTHPAQPNMRAVTLSTCDADNQIEGLNNDTRR